MKKFDKDSIVAGAFVGAMIMAFVISALLLILERMSR
jgi:hypothetical protein